jgi:hypothetical protein
LRRVASGKFDIRDALPLEDILQFSKEELIAHVIPLLDLKRYE